MEEKVSGIVLGAVNFSENDKILNIFTLEKGVLSAKIKGVKKAGAKLKFASEPFCFAEFIFSKTAEKRTVIGASLIDSFYPVREDIKKYFSAGTVVEFLRRFYKESMVDEQEFLLSVGALKEIAYGDNPLSSLVKFLINALAGFGYKLNLDGCVCCARDISGRIYFDYRSGGFSCDDCFDGVGREVQHSTFTALRLAEANSLSDSNENVAKALRLLDYYIENRVEERLSALKELIKICV